LAVVKLILLYLLGVSGTTPAMQEIYYKIVATN